MEIRADRARQPECQRQLRRHLDLPRGIRAGDHLERGAAGGREIREQPPARTGRQAVAYRMCQRRDAARTAYPTDHLGQRGPMRGQMRRLAAAETVNGLADAARVIVSSKRATRPGAGKSGGDRTIVTHRLRPPGRLCYHKVQSESACPPGGQHIKGIIEGPI